MSLFFQLTILDEYTHLFIVYDLNEVSPYNYCSFIWQKRYARFHLLSNKTFTHILNKTAIYKLNMHMSVTTWNLYLVYTRVVLLFSEIYRNETRIHIG